MRARNCIGRAVIALYILLSGADFVAAQTGVGVVDVAISQKDGGVLHFLAAKVIRHPTYGLRGSVLVADSRPSYRMSGSSRTIVEYPSAAYPRGRVTILFSIGSTATMGQVIITPQGDNTGKVVFQTRASSTKPWVTERVFLSSTDSVALWKFNLTEQ